MYAGDQGMIQDGPLAEGRNPMSSSRSVRGFLAIPAAALAVATMVLFYGAPVEAGDYKMSTADQQPDVAYGQNRPHVPIWVEFHSLFTESFFDISFGGFTPNS